LKKKRKGIFFLKMGRALLSSPAGQAGPACSTPCSPPRAVPTALRSRLPRGGRTPSTPAGWRPVAPRVRLKPLSECPLHPTPPLHPLASSSRARVGDLHHRPRTRPHRSRLFRPPLLTASHYISPRAPPPPRAPCARLSKPW
jgi:hypothetical protein